MKKLTVELTNEQSEFLNYVSKICEKTPSDFVKEAIVCLLPLNEYSAIKEDLVVLQNEEQDEIEIRKLTHQMHSRLNNINESTNERLKRIGIL